MERKLRELDSSSGVESVRGILEEETEFKGRSSYAGGGSREYPGGDQEPPTSLPLPPTSSMDLRLDGYLEYLQCRKDTIQLQTSITSPEFEPRPYDKAVSVASIIPNGRDEIKR
ncbi:hypothetical protein TNCV_3268291 [Trichonephila clavipes]|nr:hypothetical protein TNCV_3268291 [Trichonephila clavipes]